MCGIVGYVGPDEALPIILEGLRRLEYRGYDSAGIALLDGELAVVKKAGKLGELERELEHGGAPSGRVGMGHTRWATHGEPSDRNAHPHVDCSGRIAAFGSSHLGPPMAPRRIASEPAAISRSSSRIGRP